MKIIIFDVSNGDCALAVCANGNAMMIDCGNNIDKDCPVDLIEQNAYDLLNWSGLKPCENGGKLALLHITHPDDDHTKNAVKVRDILQPRLMHKRDYDTQFPEDVQNEIDEEYKRVCKLYRERNHGIELNWGFDENMTFEIPMEVILQDEGMFTKVKNNSSILRLISYKGVRVLFGGDMETAGWEWLLQHNHQNFKDEISKGIHIFMAPHHGHKSGFSGELLKIMGKPHIILSKGSEAEKEGTDVSSQYSALSLPMNYSTLGRNSAISNILTTRQNGHIFIEVDNGGNIQFTTEK